MYIHYDMDIQALQRAEVAEKDDIDSVDSVDSLICSMWFFHAHEVLLYEREEIEERTVSRRWRLEDSERCKMAYIQNDRKELD